MLDTKTPALEAAPLNPMELYDGQHMVTRYVLMTPETALAWMSEHLVTDKNRPLNQARVARYAADMRAGWWKLTHQGVAISADGVLVDGQHRLTAVFDSDTTVPMPVTVGIQEEAFTAIDTGGVRTAADVVHIAGHTKYRTLTPAITRVVHFHRQGLYEVSAAANASVTQAAILEIAEELGWDRLVEAAEAVQGAPKGFSRTVLGAFYFLAVYDRKIDPEIVVDSFLTPVFTGVGFTDERDPRLVLRNRMVKEESFGTFRKRQELLGGVARAWNLHLQGATIRSLVMPSSMPEIDSPTPGFLGRFYTGQAQV